jgi:hypothetical protein
VGSSPVAPPTLAETLKVSNDQPDSPAGLLVDEAKSIRPEVLDALDRCHTSFKLYASSTGAAFGGFYQICTAKAHLWKTFRIPTSLCRQAATQVPKRTVAIHNFLKSGLRSAAQLEFVVTAPLGVI